MEFFKRKVGGAKTPWLFASNRYWYIVMALGFVCLYLSGEIFYKVMMILTGGSITIALSMAVVVELGKYFLTVGATKIRPFLTPLNLWLYRGLRGVMVSFSFIASLFFFSQFLNDRSNLEPVREKARMEINLEYDRRAALVRQEGAPLELDRDRVEQRIKASNPKDPQHWRLVQELQKIDKAVEQDRLRQAEKLQNLEIERGKKLDKVNDPGAFDGDDRSKNQSLNAMVLSLQKGGLPVGYHGLLLVFCLLISIFLEIMIHISAAFPATLGSKKKKEEVKE